MVFNLLNGERDRSAYAERTAFTSVVTVATRVGDRADAQSNCLRASNGGFKTTACVHVSDRRLGASAHCSSSSTRTQCAGNFIGASGGSPILKTDHVAAVVADRATTQVPGWGDELVRRATAVARDTPRGPEATCLPLELARRIDRSEERAAAIASASGGCEEARRAAALEFLAEAVASLVLEKAVKPDEVRSVVADVAGAIGVSVGAASLAVFLRALAAKEVAQLPPRLAMDFLLDLLIEVGPADAVSLWTGSSSGRLARVTSAGEAPGSRRLRTAAHTIFSGQIVESPHVRGVVVERWDKPFAALVARGRPENAARLGVYLRELASALTPLFERDMLFERHAARERSLVSGGERRLVRLGFDLHDGPLQELVALAEDLRLARTQVASVLDDPQRSLVVGRFDDLEARLGSLDRGLRDIAHSVRSTSAIEQPLEHALRSEVDALGRTSGIDVELEVDGDVATLTDSQKIVLYRVVQESLSNIRKHSHATRASVRVRALSGYVSLEVSDNGCGFAADARAKRRLGLVGIVERVRLLGGDVEIEGNLGNGVLVRATLPRWRPAGEPARTPVYAATA
jgi:signal transduction histidine kinase